MLSLSLSPLEPAPPLVGAPHAAVPRRAPVDVLIDLLTVVGVICAWATAVILVESAAVAVDADGRFLMVEVKSPLFYGAHGLAIACVMAAGVLGVFSGRWRKIGLGARIALYLLVTIAAVWAALSYSGDELVSTEVFGATGPFVWFTVLFALAGADRRVWRYLDPVIRLLAYASAALAVRTLVTSEYAYYRGFSKYIQYAILLTWLGGWTLLTAARLRGWRLTVRCLPAAALVLMAICGQARSWIFLSFLLIALFFMLRAWERGSLVHGVRALALGCVVGTVAAAAVYATVPGKIGEAFGGLSQRLADDTRSGQYVDFFESVPPADLFLGRGPKGTWYWPSVGEYKFFDNGYLWILFEGGIPVLVCYFAVLVWPGLRAIRRGPTGPAAAAVGLVLLWGLALTGLSTYILPSVGIANYLVSLYAGRCWLYLAESRSAPAAGLSLYNNEPDSIQFEHASIPVA
jgi:hypothetical protein